MEAKLLTLDINRGLSSIRVRRKLTHKTAVCSPVVQAVLRRRPSATTGNTAISLTDSTTSTTISSSSSTVHDDDHHHHQDNWFDRIAIHHISQSIQTITGMKNEKSGYESFVEAATTVARSSAGDTNIQQEMVLQALNKAFPKPILSLIRFLLPQSKFTREYFAIFTTLFFAWLVGPCEVKESEVEGKMEKNVVHIKKCRFLEESNCVGMCINLCKMPSQKFIKDSLGMPVYMVPNFDDMSCDMIYGQDPPAPADDPAFRQPCFKTICKAKQKHISGCSTL